MIGAVWTKISITVLIFFAVGLSIKQRVILLKKGSKFNQVTDGPISSLLSESLAQLIGVAGGIYLSLILIISFLEIDLPNKIDLGGVSLQPLAMAALILAILQPAMSIFYDRYVKK